MSSNKINALYKSNKYLSVKLTANGKVIKNAKISIKINDDVRNLFTDSNGKVKMSTKYLLPNTYYAKIEYQGNSKIFNHPRSQKSLLKN